MKEDILRQIGTIARALDSIANIEFKEMQLNRGQYLYLVRIKENPGIISDHLAGMLNVDRTTTARSIKKLEQNQLIKKENDAENKKIKHLFVTDLGKRLAIKIEKENTYSNELVLSGLSLKQRAELTALLKVVEDNASENWRFVKNGGKREYGWIIQLSLLLQVMLKNYRKFHVKLLRRLLILTLHQMIWHAFWKKIMKQ